MTTPDQKVAIVPSFERGSATTFQLRVGSTQRAAHALLHRPLTPREVRALLIEEALAEQKAAAEAMSLLLGTDEQIEE